MPYPSTNAEFPIYKANGTSFNDLVLHQATYDEVVMSLGRKITGDVYYKDNKLQVTMQEYIVFDGVHYELVNPPTIVREGIVSDNSELKGMTKYSFEFYHPEHKLSDFSFTDVAVGGSEARYKSHDKKFAWVGTLNEYIQKLNANLATTQWTVRLSSNAEAVAKANVMSDVLTFDDNFISDALKKAYDTWEIPFVIDQLPTNDAQYASGKRFLILFGLPSNEILNANAQPYVFQFGQGVGLKNNSRTPRNNKIVTRIVGYGSEDNIPYGYPQIVWTGNQSWDYTINNSASAANSYPIYDGIVNGQRVRLIKHPFTRTRLMPSVYTESVNSKVNPYAANYNPSIELVDYYDAVDDGTWQYPNNIEYGSESVEIHQFENIKPRLQHNATFVDVEPYSPIHENYLTETAFGEFIVGTALTQTHNSYEKKVLQECLRDVRAGVSRHDAHDGGTYTYEYTITVEEDFIDVVYTSDNVNFEKSILKDGHTPEEMWDDTMDDNGNYKQSYFKVTLQPLGFDLYACAAITQEMSFYMRSGECNGCTFVVQVDWEDYKKNFFNANGDFDTTNRDYTKYPDSTSQSITVVLQKDLNTFGRIMPNRYQEVQGGDEFVILGISLPLTYITDAEEELDDAMKEYMLENNVYYYDYPLKFDEYFLAKNTNILNQIKTNTIIRFRYADEPTKVLYAKQISIKYGQSVLPQYDITLSDDIEIVLNKIGQVTDDVSRLRVQMSEIQKYYGDNIGNLIDEKLSRVADDVAQGRITFQQGIDVIAESIFHDGIQSSDFRSGLYDGAGWRLDELGNAELESLRVRSFLEVIELLVNRQQAQEGDTIFSENDQIELVESITISGNTYYRLSVKEKWDGYNTALNEQDNIIRGVINTLAAKQGNISNVTAEQSIESDTANNKYYTSWMKVVQPPIIDVETEERWPCGNNQIIVVLYGNDPNVIPGGVNFAPCQLMTIVRWGCDANPNADGLSQEEKQSIIRRQRSFYISTTDGRISKLNGVDSPILRNTNYGTTLGTLPDWVITKYPEVQQRYIQGRDYLYAQGIVVGDFIKVDINGDPLTNYVDCGEWVNGAKMPSQETPTVGHGIYLHNEYNYQTLQRETHDVWHNGGYWRCLMHQPYNGEYYEPTTRNSAHWKLLMQSESAVVADLDNEMRAVSCDQNGRTTQEYNFSIYASMWYGLTQLTLSNLTIQTDVQTTVRYNIVMSGNTPTGEIHFTIAQNAPLAEITIFNINVSALVGNSTETKTVVFTLSGIRGGSIGQDAVLYELVPSVSAIAKRKDGTFVPSIITCTKNKIKGDTITENTNEGVISYSTDGGNTYTNWLDGSELVILASFVDVRFKLTVNNVVYDKETIPIIIDGTDSITYGIDTSVDSIVIPSNATSATEHINVDIWSKSGINEKTPKTCYLVTMLRDMDGTRQEIDKRTTSYMHNLQVYVQRTSIQQDAAIEFYAFEQSNNYDPDNFLDEIEYIAKSEIVVIKEGDDGRDGQDGQDGSDGANGQDAQLYEIKTNIDSITIPSNNTSTEESLSGNFYKRVGDNAQESVVLKYVIAPRYQDGTYPTNINSMYAWSGHASSFPSFSVSVDTYTQAVVIFVYKTTTTYTTSNYYDSSKYLIKHEIPVFKNGDKGDKGQIGRSYYYDGEYSSERTYTLTSSQAPFVSYVVDGQVRYYVRIGNDGTSTTNVAPNTDNTKWEIMNSDFKYLISEAIFSDFAKLGSGVFNYDWMYSQYGEGTTLVWQGTHTQTQNAYTQVGYNVPRTYSDSGNHFPVERGKQYNVLIAARANSESLYLRVYYGINSGENNNEGNDRVTIPANTSGTFKLSFYAEMDGNANISAYGNGVVTKIELLENTNYKNMSPTFVNKDVVLLLDSKSPNPVSGASYTSPNSKQVTPAGIYVMAGMTYTISITAKGTNGGTLNAILCELDKTTVVSSNSLSITLSGTTTEITSSRPFTVISNFSGWASIRCYVSTSSVSATITNISVTAQTPFIPKVAIDWRAGYAHFGGDNIRFNPDGSGYLAGGNVVWDESGNADFSGVIRAKTTYLPFYDVNFNEVSSPFVINPITHGSKFLIEPKPSTASTQDVITLPSANDFNGMEVLLFIPQVTRTSVNNVQVTSSSPFSSGVGTKSSIYIVQSRMLRLVAIPYLANGVWFVIGGSYKDSINGDVIVI